MVRDPDSGMASWYTDARTSTGEALKPYSTDPSDFRCASPDEPAGTLLRVRHGDKSLVCRVVDIGPASYLSQKGPREKRRKIDLTPSQFRYLGVDPVAGVIPVTIERE